MVMRKMICDIPILGEMHWASIFIFGMCLGSLICWYVIERARGGEENA